VLHHRHTGAGEREDDQTGDIEAARVIATGAHDVERAGRPLLDAGIERAGAKHTRETGDLVSGLALGGQGGEERGLGVVGLLRASESERRSLDLRGEERATGSKRNGEVGERGHGSFE